MKIRNFKVLGMLGLPLAAMAVVAVLLSMNLGSSHKAAADFPHLGVDFSAGVGAGCDSGLLGPAKCVEPLGSAFKVSVKLNSNGGINMAGYDAQVNFTAGLDYSADKGTAPNLTPLEQVNGQWPGCNGGFAASSLLPGAASVACGLGLSGSPAPYTGSLFLLNLKCVGTDFSTETITLVHGSGNTQIADELSTNHGEANATSESITISCTPATSTFTPTPTKTPPPIPPVFKSPALQNVFLLRQGAKLQPQRCDDSTDVATLTEQIGFPVTSLSPKGDPQTVAAFEFEVRFDPTKVCVNLAPTANWVGPNQICTVQDKDSSTLEGIARIGCVTIGKGVKPTGLTLATISVRPQPEIYSQLRPNQDNGQAIQILNQGCELADEQGHAIAIFSCEDADITFRFLEGDVDGPDCAVDVFDTQQVAFRWGVNKGSLLYNSFLDLEPSGQVKGDGDIDIKDIQFVFGRFGSTCANPWPAQAPVNPKA